MSVISYPPFTKLMAPSSSDGSKIAQDPGEIPKRFKTTISVCSQRSRKELTTLNYKSKSKNHEPLAITALFSRK